MADDQALATQAPAADPALRWENASTQELRAIIGRGLAGGDEVAAAIAETERRARARAAAEAPAPAVSPYSQRRFRTLVVATVMTIVVGIALGLWLAT